MYDSLVTCGDPSFIWFIRRKRWTLFEILSGVVERPALRRLHANSQLSRLQVRGGDSGAVLEHLWYPLGPDRKAVQGGPRASHAANRQHLRHNGQRSRIGREKGRVEWRMGLRIIGEDCSTNSTKLCLIFGFVILKDISRYFQCSIITYIWSFWKGNFCWSIIIFEYSLLFWSINNTWVWQYQEHPCRKEHIQPLFS